MGMPEKPGMELNPDEAAVLERDRQAMEAESDMGLFSGDSGDHPSFSAVLPAKQCTGAGDECGVHGFWQLSRTGAG